MNVLNNARAICPNLWTGLCCQNLTCIKTVREVRRKRASVNKSDAPLTRFCRNNLEQIPSLSMWVQVRYHKECPRLHRDIEFPNFNPYRKDQYKDVRKTRWGAGDEKSGVTYTIGFFGLLCGSYAVKSELVHFISYMAAAADVLAMASIEVDLTKITPGACVSYKWRGKPLFIKRRTQADIDIEAKTPLSVLRDPETPEQRTTIPEWLIVIGICTHLGCVPIANAGDYPGGFYCPCHGSHYDNVGRARKGPAPLNLEVPPYKFVSDSLVIVG
ncbi:cytochrome b-c1 complex subunit Rieske, mitochondrial-like [Bombyx mandarina]|uniref:Cytochrome b-c1 complex subunit Rieske, mitochondrial n=2 Tax=Bombyx TaxID=7090 RepID=A0A8R1WM34_BOMMO|nr:cytochrome b-c1 complex subunit Rieske, mitochondrial [Bombyx mori]XP_028035493.1 cytochrome b-c1 complex subunit Rieske, mitochondrial-like [Bombyx mandarina]